MLYGEDFLNALNNMLNDERQTSSRVSQQCQKCHKRIRNQMESQGLGDLIPVCNACSTAGLIDFDDGDGTYSLVDLVAEKQTKDRLAKSAEHEKKQAYKSERITKYYIDKYGNKVWGKNPNPEPKRRSGKYAERKGSGRYFYDAYGNRQEDDDSMK